VSGPRRAERWFGVGLLIVLGAGLVLRMLYVHAQVGSDPWFVAPRLDGAAYLAWGRAWAEGRGVPAGAFYLAPLYPWALALLFRLGGDAPATLYVVQQVLSVATAGALAVAGRPSVGSAGALASAVLFLGYAPLEFFASRPLGETLALALLVAALAIGLRASRVGWFGLAGLLVGAATLARPNLLLVGLAWVAVEAARRHTRRALWLVVGLALAILPVTVRNWVVSGHVVLVSSNAGITLYHGNGPGARGVYHHPQGFPRGLETIEQQRADATRVARARTGRELDPVEADAWWAGEALRERVAHPAASAYLLWRRVLLLLDNYEFGLDYPPRLDPNPWRLTWRLGGAGAMALVPWALIVGLAGAALVQHGVRGAGGAWTWTAIAACAATPLVFFVSSRYRLPLAALLTLPAGAGLAGLVLGAPRRKAALGLGLVVAAFSLAVPTGTLAREEGAGAFSSRSIAWRRAGRIAEAEADAREAVRRLPESAWLRYNLGVVLAQAHQAQEAEAEYRESLRLDPELAEASVNLGVMLFERGRFAEAAAILRAAVFHSPSDASCWTNLVAVLAAAGDRRGALAAASEARTHGIEVPPELLRLVERLAPDAEGSAGGPG